jgi:hypothetical protein
MLLFGGLGGKPRNGFFDTSAGPTVVVSSLST